MKLNWKKEISSDRSATWLEALVQISPLIQGWFTIETDAESSHLFFENIYIKHSKSIDVLKRHAEKILQKTAERLMR